jgi:hypothetical protein
LNKEAEPGIIRKPLPSVHVGTGRSVKAGMGVEMKTFAAPMLDFGETGSPSNEVKPVAVKAYPVVDRI